MLTLHPLLPNQGEGARDSTLPGFEDTLSRSWPSINLALANHLALLTPILIPGLSLHSSPWGLGVQ